jgi:RimJ/RimL family protein N-acetyltransferase
MSGFESITIREVESSDLETFYEHQLDPEAIRMAAFVCEDPKDKAAFDAHWDKILNASQNITRTIVAEGQVAGHISCYPHGENIEVTYWLGREFWGRGLATQALNRMLHLVVDRPIFARAATDNIGSIRVLQKCGFKIVGKTKISPMAQAKTRKNLLIVFCVTSQLTDAGPVMFDYPPQRDPGVRCSRFVGHSFQSARR